MIYRYSIPTVKRGTITISRDLNEERTGAIPSSMKKLLQRRNIRLSQIFFLFFPFYFTHLFLQDHSTLSFIRYTHDNLNKRRPKHQSFVSLEYPHYSIFLLKVTKDMSLKKPIFFLWRHTKSFNYSMLISYKIKIVSNQLKIPHILLLINKLNNPT